MACNQLLIVDNIRALTNSLRAVQHNIEISSKQIDELRRRVDRLDGSTQPNSEAIGSIRTTDERQSRSRSVTTPQPIRTNLGVMKRPTPRRGNIKKFNNTIKIGEGEVTNSIYDAIMMINESYNNTFTKDDKVKSFVYNIELTDPYYQDDIKLNEVEGIILPNGTVTISSSNHSTIKSLYIQSKLNTNKPFTIRNVLIESLVTKHANINVSDCLIGEFKQLEYSSPETISKPPQVVLTRCSSLPGKRMILTTQQGITIVSDVMNCFIRHEKGNVIVTGSSCIYQITTTSYTDDNHDSILLLSGSFIPNTFDEEILVTFTDNDDIEKERNIVRKRSGNQLSNPSIKMSNVFVSSTTQFTEVS